MIERRKHRIERTPGRPKEFVTPDGGSVTIETGGMVESVAEDRCPSCGRWFEVRGVLGPLFMRLGATREERHQGKAPIEDAP